jgi:purine-binding chemotaxis protein CheW
MTTQVCSFAVADHMFGVEVHAVQEVLRFQRMTRVPLAPPEVEGLINLRGQIVTAFDLRRRLCLPPRDPDEQPMNVVVQTPHGAVSLLVDQIGDVIEVEEDAFEAPPETLAGPVRAFVRGVFKLEDRLLVMLDVERCADLSASVPNREPGRRDR